VDLTYNAITDNRSPAFINSRTISGDPAIVTEKALAYVTCLQQSGIFATLKHFPGHGATTEDSHFKLPIINKDKEDWLKSDAQPYLEIQEARLIMVGHLLFSELDNDNPATQSPEIITAILRNEMNYQGVIITDDLKQLLNSTNVPLREALKKAVNSGIDIVLYITTKENGQEAVRQLASLIESQEIPREKVNQAIVRILKLKMLINSQF
ncbi:MAG TPA: glycoside hydrolase family 3 N-terminal domain-containing protein, partial [Candidatus Dojkabacteria bacterium]|nr:glycoside hydrolase family 3 N-terminal domain-containing protein [Candidatus Dojkabacteria bacterium]